MEKVNTENVKKFLQDAEFGSFNSKNELKDYLIDEAELRADYVADLSPLSLLDKYLKYNGIIGFTEDIINAVLHAYEIGE